MTSQVVVQIDKTILNNAIMGLNSKGRLELHYMLASKMLQRINRNMESRGRLFGRRWKPLKPSTIYGRRKKSDKPLLDTGKMKNSFRMQATPTKAIVGSPSKIAKIHHFGVAHPWKITPKHGKALAFPFQQGGNIFQRQRGEKSPSLTKRKISFFKSKGLQKRSNVWLSQTNFLVRRSVIHPGLPARPLLPGRIKGLDMMLKEIRKIFIEKGMISY